MFKFIVRLLLVYTWLLCPNKAVNVLIDTFKGTCPGFTDKPKILLENSQFHLNNYTTYISHNVTITEDIPGDIKFEVFPTRCKSKDALDTCETYRAYKLKNVCRFITSDKVPWAPFVHNYRPNVKCPFKKGVYTLSNGTLDPTALPQWTKSYWKVATVLRQQDTDLFLFCTFMEFQIV